MEKFIRRYILREPPDCGGDWHCGTACGKCQHCLATAQKAIDFMIEVNERQGDRLFALLQVLPFRASAYIPDFSSEYKIKCFEQARNILYADAQHEYPSHDQSRNHSSAA